MNVIMVVIDGLADRPAEVLDGRTPLEAASTPNLDSIVSRGSAGLIFPLGPGVAPGTDTAHFVFFGNPIAEYPGRGLFEAAGQGLAVARGEVVITTRLCQVEPEPGYLRVVRRILDEEPTGDAADLVEDISRHEVAGYRLELVRTGGWEAILYVRGGGASPAITDSDPYLDGLPVAAVEALTAAEDQAEAVATAEAVTTYLRWAHARLEQHPVNARRRGDGLAPANFLASKWAAAGRPITQMGARFGFQPASVSTGILFRGLCSELGLTFRNVDYLEDPAQDMRRRVDVAIELSGSGYDFVHVHTKVVDQAAHTKDPDHKRQVIESVDAGLARLAEEVMPDTVVVVTADHATPSWGDKLLIHSGEPVPLAVVAPTVAVDDVTRFCERSCSEGALGRTTGADLMPQIANWADRAGFYGARMSPDAVIARPAAPNPFTPD